MKFIISSIILLHILSCNSETKYQNSTIQSYTVDLDKMEEISLYNIFSKVEIIPLKTPDSLVCSGIHSYIFRDCIFFWDRRQHIILGFDMNGNYLYKIDDRGRGPKEYLNIDYVSIDPYNNYILILDSRTGVSQYDFKGNFVNKIRLPHKFVANECAMINRDTILYINNQANGKTNILNFFSIKENKFVNSTYVEEPIFMVSTSVHSYQNKTYYCICKEPIVYDVSQANLSPAYRWDFGKYNYNYQDLSIPVCKNQYELMKIQVPWIYKNCPWFLISVMENSKYICADISLFAKIPLSEKKSPACYIFYNKATGEYYITPHFKEGRLFHAFCTFNEEAVYTAVERNSVKDYINPDHLDSRNRKILEELPEDCNPVILKYCFK